MTSILTAQAVSFELPNGRELFKELSFSLNSNITALVGPNGVGKTCLARILTGELEPTSGHVHRDRKIALLRQHQTPPDISVEAFLTDAYSWSLTGERLLLNISRAQPCSLLSGGQWMRVRLALALSEEYLILDEPTNNLDRDGREAVLEFLRAHRGGALLISHDREGLGLCNEVLELSSHGLFKFGGGWTAYLDAREHKRARLHQNLTSAKRDRDEAALKRATQKERQERRNRRGTQKARRGGLPKLLSGRRQRQAQATTGHLDELTHERSEKAIQDTRAALEAVKIDPVMYADLIPSELPAQKLIAEAQDFNIQFQEWIYPRDLNFVWRGPIRLALKGHNGAGKSTLLKAISGATFEMRGQWRLGDLTMLYIDQQGRSLNDEKSVLENIRETSTLSESDLRNGLAKFLFTGETVFQKTGELSGGERLRAALAKGFLSTVKPELLILDEPTNNLDLVNVEFLEGLVSRFRGAVLIVSHDDTFLKNCEVTQFFEL